MILKSEDLRREFGERARDTVRRNFLMTRLLEEYLDLFNSFETRFIVRSEPRESIKPTPCPSARKGERPS